MPTLPHQCTTVWEQNEGQLHCCMQRRAPSHLPTETQLGMSSRVLVGLAITGPRGLDLVFVAELCHT